MDRDFPEYYQIEEKDKNESFHWGERFPGWVCKHGNWVIGRHKTCHGLDKPLGPPCKVEDAIVYDEQDWLCHFCGENNPIATKVQYNLTTDAQCHYCDTSRGWGRDNNSIEFVVCRTSYEDQVGNQQKCGYTNRVGDVTNLDTAGIPRCRRDGCKARMPFKEPRSAAYDVSVWVMALKMEPSSRTKWLCRPSMHLNALRIVTCEGIHCEQKRDDGIAILNHNKK